MECPYCKGELEVALNSKHIGAYAIVCSNCGAVWVDEDDIDELA